MTESTMTLPEAAETTQLAYPTEGANGVTTDAWPDWVVTDVEHRLGRLRGILEGRASRHGGSTAGASRDAPAATAALGLAPLGDRRPPGPSGFDLVSRLFGLSAFEEDVLALALSSEVDTAFPNLIAAVHGNASAPYPTPHLALDIFAGSFADRLVARRSFLPGSALMRFRLIRLDDPGLAGATPGDAILRLEPRVADLLLGVNRLDETIRQLIERVDPGPLASAHRDQVDSLAADLRGILSSHPRPVLNLVGDAGSGRHVFAQAVCATLGLELYELDLAALPADRRERESLLRAVDRDAVQSAFALYVDRSAAPDDPKILADVLRDRESFVIVGSANALRLRPGDVTVDVPGPSPSRSVERWVAALGTDLAEGDEVFDVAEQFAFGPRSIQRAAALASQQAMAEGRPVTTADLVRASRRQAGTAMDDLAQRIEPRYDWDDIVLPADLADQLHEIAGQVGRRYQVYERWGFGTKHARGRGITVLFAGPSGTGKTMAAEVLANDLGLDLYRIDLAGVVSKYIGETEKNLRRLFDAAERTGSVLLFDEADALFGKRTEVRDSHDRYANIEINYLLQRMEDYRGLAILATNMRSLLDHAFLRRLRFILDFPFPDRAGRRAIWARVFPPEAGAEIDPDALARLEVAGGSIRSIAINAAFFAAADGDAIGMAHVMRAARREYSKIDKLVVEAEFHPRPGASA
jgi:hypothetical protein